MEVLEPPVRRVSGIKELVNNNSIVSNGTPLDSPHRPSDFGGDTDCETYPPSDSEQNDNDSAPTEITTILSKMEELNKMNEADARSVTSKRSEGSSESNAGGGSPARSYGVNDSRHGSCQPDDEENLDLWTVWGNLIKSWEVEMKKRPNYVKGLVRQGVPQHFRTIAWQLMSCANTSAVHDLYAEYLRTTSPYEKVILRDIPRTYPELEFFKDGGRGQSSLFNVIRAYSVHDREVGYCQGSAFIAGQLLLQMPEEEAFAVFLRLMEHYRLRELYKPTMTELGLCMFQLECVVQEQMPDLYMHFNNMGFDTSMYASSWFLTLFTTTLPLDLANRIMDLFLVDGMDAVFRVALAILQQSRVDLLTLDMEGMLKYFQRDIRERFENDHELLFTVANQVSLNSKKMKRLEKEYLAKRTKEQEEAIELRRLRTENRLLRQRIDYLEQESSALADRLIRGQVDLAHQADNCLSISHELNVLRDINSDAHRRLEDAYETIRTLSNKRGNGVELKETGSQVDDTSMIEHIHSLQQEVIEAHSRKADLEGTIRDLKMRIQDLESANKRLREAPPDGGVAAIQEELIQVKMREAEASLSLKDMRQRIAELEQHWVRYVQNRMAGSPIPGSEPAVPHSQSLHNVSAECPSATSSPQHSPQNGQPSAAPSTSSAPQTARGRLAKLTATLIGAASAVTSGEGNDDNVMTLRELEDQLMGLRIRETDAVAELKEMRQKVMELETQNHVCTNQLKRQDEELKRVKEEKATVAKAERELSALLRDEQRKLMTAESETKEKSVMQRLKYTEALQTIADLRQHIAQLESKRAEKFAHAQLRGTSVCDVDEDSVASNRSVGSIADTNSLASEDISSLVVDVNAGSKPAVDRDADKDAAAETDDEAETETEIEKSSHRSRPRNAGSSKASNGALPSSKKPANVAAEGDTTDSGVQLSDS
ncbi:Protein TBC-4 [Aphelenchoides avenae]|nr:Protein TBC-4 [Aphelenchus avenae]